MGNVVINLTSIVLAAITEREGTAIIESISKTEGECGIQKHFDAYYNIFDMATPEEEIIEVAYDQLSEYEILDMRRRWGCSDRLELLQLEGYLTELDGIWLLSVEYFKFLMQ